MIEGKLYKWSKRSVQAVKKKPAKYELYDEDKNVIYIGSSGDLSERFRGYWATNFEGKKCKQRTRFYKRQYVASEKQAEKLERENLEEYESLHGELPDCNKKVI